MMPTEKLDAATLRAVTQRAERMLSMWQPEHPVVKLAYELLAALSADPRPPAQPKGPTLADKWRYAAADERRQSLRARGSKRAIHVALAVQLDACAAELEAHPLPSPAPRVTPAQMAALSELADDLGRIVSEVSSRDGDATARQHLRAEAVRAAVAALSLPSPALSAEAPRPVAEGWQPKWPTEAGWYWCYGNYKRSNQPSRLETVLVRVDAQAKPFYVSHGDILYPETWEGVWQPLSAPPLPDGKPPVKEP